MKQGIHPDYKEATVTCGCGNTFKTGSVKLVVVSNNLTNVTVNNSLCSETTIGRALGSASICL